MSGWHRVGVRRQRLAFAPLAPAIAAPPCPQPAPPPRARLPSLRPGPPRAPPLWGSSGAAAGPATPQSSFARSESGGRPTIIRFHARFDVFRPKCTLIRGRNNSSRRVSDGLLPDSDRSRRVLKKGTPQQPVGRGEALEGDREQTYAPPPPESAAVERHGSTSRRAAVCLLLGGNTRRPASQTRSVRIQCGVARHEFCSPTQV